MRTITLIILCIALLMSGFTFWSFSIIQKDTLIANNRFCKDLGTLFAYNIVNFIDNTNQQDLASFIEEIYISTASIRYILFFNIDGSLFFSLPIYKNNIQDILQVHQNLLQLETQNFLFNTPLLQHNILLNDNLTNVILPLNKNGHNLGSLDLGINSNININTNSSLIFKMSIFIFVCIWLLVILFATLHVFIIAQPMKQLLDGMKKISLGEFSNRLHGQFNNEWNDLLISFNEMAERLEYYDKKNIDKLTLEKHKLESIASIITDGVILVDLDLRLLFVNSVAKKSFNWSNLNLIGSNITSHLPLHILNIVLPIFNYLAQLTYVNCIYTEKNEISVDIEYDSKKNFRFLFTAIIDHNTKVLTGIVIIIQDVSREVILNKAKNQFISNVSHELRTPLCNIGSFLETLLDYNESLNEKQKIHFLKIANNETQRLSKLVNDILDLSRLESSFRYDLSNIKIDNLLIYILNTYQLIANKYNIKLILEIEPGISYVRGHESSFVQIMSNLLSNAIKFTNNYSQIIIRVYSVISLPFYHLSPNNKDVSTLIRIELIDEGIGIDNRDQKIIFDRFVRIENNIHTLQGTGLGLSIVKNILKKYSTNIFLKSEILVGTSLWFDLFQR